MDSVRIFIGTEPRMWRGEAVLRYSIDKHVTGPVEVHSMDRTRDPTWRGWDIGRAHGEPAGSGQGRRGEPGAVWYTDFTNFRWAIPEVAGFTGRAIYVDVDEIFLRDPRELWELPIPAGKGVLSLSPTLNSVMLFDCAYFRDLAGWPSIGDMRVNRWHMQRYIEVLSAADAFAPLPPEWNCLDGYNGDQSRITDRVALVHYTEMRSQVWRPYPDRLRYRRHPFPELEDLWMQLFEEALEAGYIPAEAPPEGRLADGVPDLFLDFLEQHREERSWKETLSETPGRSATRRHSRSNPSPAYQEHVALYQRMHRDGAPACDLSATETFAGKSLLPHVATIGGLLSRHGGRTILDYGSGKGLLHGSSLSTPDGRTFSGTAELWKVETVTCYDPAWEPFSTPPSERFDGVICTDVLEHCPEEDLPWILDEIFGYARKFVFASIACYPAVKRLPNGENAHVTVRPPVWWKELIGSVAAEHAAVEHYFVLELRIPCAGDATRVRAKRELIRGPPLRLKAMY